MAEYFADHGADNVPAETIYYIALRSGRCNSYAPADYAIVHPSLRKQEHVERGSVYHRTSELVRLASCVAFLLGKFVSRYLEAEGSGNESARGAIDSSGVVPDVVLRRYLLKTELP